MAEQEITQGVLNAIFNHPDEAASRFPVPVMQCLQIKALESKGGPGGPARFRIVLSDIHNYIQCMLTTQVNHFVQEGKLVRGSIVRVKQYQSNSVQGKNILIILDLDVVENLGAPDKFGEPVAVEVKPEAQPTNIGGAGFYGVKNETQESKPAIAKSLPTRADTSGESQGGATIYPIEALSPYARKWTIKARVTNKSDIRTWHKPSGEGKLFSVNLLDESGEIKATGFNEQCDAFYDLLQEGQVYYISSPCKVSFAKKQFTNLPNDYELAFERDTVIEKAEGESNVPQLRFNFCTIQELQSVEKDTTVDVIGVLKEVSEVNQIVSKSSGKPYEKRELTLVDDTGYSVRITVWGKTANSFDAAPESVVAFKGTRVSDFGGRSLSLLASGTMSIDPDIPEAHKLKGWYDASGRNDSFQTHNNLASMGAATGGRQDQTLTISEVKDQNIGLEDTAYFTLKATIVYIKQDNFAYPACANEGCNKKVTETGDGTWRCEKCEMSHQRPQWRYIMTVSVADHTSQLYLSCFDEVARVIMNGRSADELMDMRNNDQDQQLTAEFEAANCRKLSFRVRSKMDTYADTQRIRYQVQSVSVMDYKTEAARLADLVQQMSV